MENTNGNKGNKMKITAAAKEFSKNGNTDGPLSFLRKKARSGPGHNLCAYD